MAYNSDRKGYETKDGGLIRINGSGDKVRIDVYDGDEREKGGHTRDSINYDTNTGKGSIDSHNEDKSDCSSKDVGCFLTSACMKHFQEVFNDNCDELMLLRWFRDNFVSKEDIEHYYITAPIIVSSIDSLEDNSKIYDYIYNDIIRPCVSAIKNGDYDFAYDRYKISVVALDDEFAKPALKKEFVKSLKLKIT